MKQQNAFERKKTRVRAKLKFCSRPRLSVVRSLRHISAQVFTANGSKVLVAASSQEEQVRSKQFDDKRAVAAVVGALVAERALHAGLKLVAFDRSGYKFHGRVKALAEAARSAGLDF